jgi:hypothetical protein
MDVKTRAPRASRSEFQMILEFIGIRTIIAVGMMGALYFVSAYYNYFYQSKSFLQSFSPYYALRIHDGNRLISNAWDGLWGWVWSWIQMVTNFFYAQWLKIQDFFVSNVEPYLADNPKIAIVVFLALGFVAFTVLILIVLYGFKFIYSFLPGSKRLTRSTDDTSTDDLWVYDPSKKTSDEQLKKMVKSLERLIQQAPAMSGQVPKDADISLKTMAARNKDSEFNHRYAAYVMGPIKGTKFDNGHELPLALDQIKRITTMMGKSAEYEPLPVDFVMVRAKKGKTSWEVAPNMKPIKCGSAYPIKTIEAVMNKYRNYFIWDTRVKKSNVGYGQR